MTDIDVRFNIDGLSLKNKDEMMKDSKSLIADMNSALAIGISDDASYKVFKQCRKALKDARCTIESDRKSKINSFKKCFDEDIDEIVSLYDKPISTFDDAIKKYEIEENIGAQKGNATRFANKSAKYAIVNSLQITLACPTLAVRQMILQFATDLGAIEK